VKEAVKVPGVNIPSSSSGSGGGGGGGGGGVGAGAGVGSGGGGGGSSTCGVQPATIARIMKTEIRIARNLCFFIMHPPFQIITILLIIIAIVLTLGLFYHT
jgi:hypothetical protein